MSESLKHVDHLVRGWTSAQLAGQMFLLAFPGKDTEKARPLFERYNISGCYISQDNAETFEESQKLAETLNSYSFPHGIGAPLILGVDQEGAWGYLVPESRTGPGNLALGSMGDPKRVADLYSVFAQEMQMAGMTAVLGPCADINLNEESAIIDTRSFGADVDLVCELVNAAVRGGQRGGLLSCAKHFPGHGSTVEDTHRDLPTVDKPLAQLWEEDLKPFQAAVNAGVDLMMTSHIRYPAIDPEFPATLSKAILQDVLRNEMGFDGVILSDSMNMGAIRKHYPPEEAALLAIEAGIDLIMLSEEHYDHDADYILRQQQMIQAVVQALEDGRLARSRVEDSVRRILKLRFKLADRSIRAEKDLKEGLEDQISFDAITETGADSFNWSGHERVLVVNATAAESYNKLMNARGIGPNQSKGAYPALVENCPDVWRFVDREKFDPKTVGNRDLLLLVTEDHPLPGEDFTDGSEVDFINQAIEHYENQTAIIRLGSPYMLNRIRDCVPILCSHSGRECSAKAMARFLTEKID